jgi:catechol 2,3-dioxygenase-like lactoylglutathione lyase family enzyme
MGARPTLIAQLGEVMQMAFVPRDFDAALKFWTETMGVGPFFLNEHVRLQEARYRGLPTDIDFGIAIAYWGDIQIELVRQHNDAPSIYKEWLDAGREGLHHVCLVVDSLDHARGVCAAAGASVLQEGKLTGGEVIYVEPRDGQGPIVEIIQLPGAAQHAFAAMRDAARVWDGSEPVRRLG